MGARHTTGTKLLLILVMSFVFVLTLSVSSIATLNVSLSDQGTGVRNKTSGQLLETGNITIEIYETLSGGSAIYSQTFANGIVNGSWNVMLGETTGLPLEYGKVYYRAYEINGEAASFTNGTGGTVGRQYFYAPLGDINGTNIIDGTIDGTEITDNSITGSDINNQTNLTLGEKISFTLGGIVDNILNGWVAITGNASVSGDLNVTGDINVNGNMNFQNISGNDATFTTLTVTGTSNLSNVIISNVEIDTNNISVNEISSKGSDLIISNNNAATDIATFTESGRVGIGTDAPNGTLHVIGNSILVANFTNQTGNSVIGIGGAAIAYTQGGLQLTPSLGGNGLFIESDGNVSLDAAFEMFDTNENYTRFITGVQDGSIVYTLPITAPTDGQVLAANSSGEMFWTTDDESAYLINGTDANFTNLWVTGTSYLSNVTVNSDNITVNEIHSRDGNLTFFDAAGYEQMRVTDDGKVGIGTSSPNGLLHVYEDSSARANITMQNPNSSGGAMLNLESDTGSAYLSMVGSNYPMSIVANRGLLNVDNAADGLIFHPGNTGNIIFATGNLWNQSMNIESDGKVGINTSTPSHTLNVKGDANITGNLIVGNSVISDLNVTGDLRVDGVSYLSNVTVNSDNITVNKVISRDGNLSFYDNAGTENVRFTEDGRVGIGTTAPDAHLHVQKSAEEVLVAIKNTLDGFTSSASLDIYNADDDYVRLGIFSRNNSDTPPIFQNRSVLTSNAPSGMIFASRGASPDIVFTQGTFTERMRIDSNGQLGIGTASPTELLDVNGSVNVSGTLYANNVSSNSPLRLQTGGTTRLFINDTGRIAIGKEITSEFIDIQGTTNDPNDDQLTMKLFNTNSSGIALYRATAGQDYGVVFAHAGADYGFGSFANKGMVMSERLSEGLLLTADNGTITFMAGDTGTYPERAFIAKTGQFGINTTSPTHTLHVNGSANISGTLYTGTTVSSGLTVEGDLNVTGVSYLSNVTVNADNITVNEVHSRDGNLSFYDNQGNLTIHINETKGSVGIGAPSVRYPLEVIGDVNDNHFLAIRNANNGASATSMVETSLDSGIANFGIASESFAAPLMQNRGIIYAHSGANGISLIADNVSADIKFATGGQNERMVIDSDGNIGINNSDPQKLLSI
ncbi:beta strand repeat-containing protein, partial [Nanoarchaeota archaeon]